jgi:hypothetical protein
MYECFEEADEELETLPEENNSNYPKKTSFISLAGRI